MFILGVIFPLNGTPKPFKIYMLTMEIESYFPVFFQFNCCSIIKSG